MRYKVEQHFVAICLVWSAVCFGIGVTLQHGSRAVASLGGAR